MDASNADCVRHSRPLGGRRDLPHQRLPDRQLGAADPGLPDPARHQRIHARPADPAVRRRRGQRHGLGRPPDRAPRLADGDVRLFAVAGCFGLLLVALAPNVPLAAVAMYLFGGMIGGMDVAMNANAVVGREEAGARHHVVLARLLEPWRLRRRRRSAASPSRTTAISPHAALVTVVALAIVGCRAPPPGRRRPAGGAGAPEILAAAQPD